MFGEGGFGKFVVDLVFVSFYSFNDGIFCLSDVRAVTVRGGTRNFIYNIGTVMEGDGIFERGIKGIEFIFCREGQF